MNSNATTHAAVERVVRQEWGRVLAALLHRVGQFELAEDALQDAFVAALSRWPQQGVPANPGGWLLRTAERKAIDIMRRSRVFQSRQQQLTILAELDSIADPYDSAETPEIPDERLKLIFTCCHPALTEEVSVALTLKSVCGLNTLQIAKAFLVPQATMAQRIVRAKRKISLSGIPYRIPPAKDWPERMNAVLAVVYLIFNEGYSAYDGTTHSRADLCEEAIRLGRLLVELAPTEAEASGLTALMLLHHSRRKSRSGPIGEIVPLDAQDRLQWDQECIFEGLAWLEHSFQQSSSPGYYTLQARLSAIHATTTSFSATDWPAMLAVYDQMLASSSNPVVQLNRAVAISYACGPQEGLQALEELAVAPRIASYQPYHAAHADMLARLGDRQAADQAYARAIELSHNQAEQAFLRKKQADLQPGPDTNGAGACRDRG